MSQVYHLPVGTGSGVLTLTGNSGGAIPPDGGGNIDILGSGGVNIAGNAGLNRLTITVSGTGISWSVEVAGFTAAAGNGYFCNGGATLSVALPAVSSVGDTFTVVAMNAAGWQITQAAGQFIRVGNDVSTTGVGGNIGSTAIGDTVTLVCNVANTGWIAVSTVGNIGIN